MRFCKTSLALIILFALGACSSQPPENTDVAQAANDTATTESSLPDSSAVADTAEPAAPVAKPAASPAKREIPSLASSTNNRIDTKNEVTPPPAPAPKKVETVVIPSGTVLDIVLSDALNSGKNKTGDEFVGNLAAPVYVDGKTILERGSKVQGTVVDAKGSGRVSGKATMTLVLTGVMHNDKMVPISTQDFATEAESSTGRDVGVIGGGAGVGAIIGAIAGGKKGAATGAAIGGAAGTGTVLATKGKEVDFPAESNLSFVLEGDVTLTL